MHTKFLGSTEGVTIDSPAGVAHITDTHNTGYMLPDTNLAALCDTETGSITGGTTLDRSGNNNHLNIIGTLNRQPIGNGEIAAWSGFSGSNYLEMPYTPDLDFGTGDFYVMGWLKLTAGGTAAAAILSRAVTVSTDEFLIYRDLDGKLAARLVSLVYKTTEELPLNAWSFVTVIRRSGVLELAINTAVTYSAANSENITKNAPLFIGVRSNSTIPFANGSLALWRIGAGAPTPDQIAKIYRDELAMIQGKATLDGNDPAVKALAYDKERDLLHVASQGVVSSFRGLERVESTPSTVGDISSLSSQNGAVITGGSTGVDVQLPEVNIRERLAKTLHTQHPTKEDFGFTGDGTETTFTLNYGWKPKRVWVDGVKKRQGSAEDYTISSDGFKYSVVFAVAPALDAEIDVEGVSV